MKKYQKGLLSVIALACIAGSSVFAADTVEIENGVQLVKKDIRTNYLQETLVQNVSKYDIRDAMVSDEWGLPIDVYNQGSSGTCWAHALKQVYETTLRKTTGQVHKISIPHIIYGRSDSFNNGTFEFELKRDAIYKGMFVVDGIAYFTNGTGPINDTAMPGLNNYIKPSSLSGDKKAPEIPVEEITGRTSEIIVKDWITLTDPIASITGVRDTSYNRGNDMNNIKEHLKQYGGVTAYLSFETFNNYYDTNTYGFYYPATGKGGDAHEVSIIGWDDNYSAQNFKTKPSRNGAWIAVNSWGEKWGNNGTFYISYDQNILSIGIRKIGYKNDEKIYQYDGKTVNAAKTVNANEFYMANVYTRENPNEEEFLKEIGLTTAYNTDFEVYLNPNSGEITEEILGKAIYTSKEAMVPGYHTFEVPQIELTGEKFAVVVKYKKSGSNKFGRTYLERQENNTYSTVESAANKSFYGASLSSLEDIGAKAEWACIKAITNKLEEKYDLSEKTPINEKDQGKSENCWTMPIATVFETNRTLKDMISDEISSKHMDYATSQSFLNKAFNSFGYNRTVNSAGTAEWALAYFTNGMGPIYEMSMPFNEDFPDIDIRELTNKIVIAKVKEWIQFPTIVKSITNGVTKYTDGNDKEYTNEEIKSIRNEIKKHIKINGAISTELCINESYKYYNSDTKAYYCADDKSIVDHGVSIIGWDDNYSKENFNDGAKPSTDGAYIVQNSWGKDSEVAEKFYISYEDQNVEKKLYGIVNSVDKDNTETIYQYDELGRNTEFSIGTEEAYGANVFTRDDKDKEVLNEISISIYKDMNYEVYVNPNNGNLNSEELILVSKSDTPIGNGYHTIEFDTPIELTGKKFAIAVKYMGTDDTLITMQAKTTGSYSTVSSNSGESFVGANLDDMVDLKDIEGLPEGNICIKAFTNKEGATYSVIEGDINLDGHITATDMSALEMHLAGIKYLRGDSFYASDFNDDLRLTPVDLSILKKRLANIR